MRLRSLAAALALLALLARSAPAQPPASSTRLPAAPAAPRFLALGDSYTAGPGVKGRERWPLLLAEALRRDGMRLAEPEIIAESGWTTNDLAGAIAARHPSPPFDLVLLLIGANDQFQSRGLDVYRAMLKPLLATATRLAGCDPSRVVVLSIPDWSVTPFAAGRDRARIAADIAGYNAVCREETELARARWVDITPASQHAADDRSLLVGDGLHPSAALYARWAEIISPVALQVVREGRGSCGSPQSEESNHR